MKNKTIFTSLLMIAVSFYFAGCSELEQQCQKLKDNPALKDPALEKKCVEIVSFLPPATNSLANQAVLLPTNKSGSTIIVSLIATDNLGAPIDTLTTANLTAKAKNASGVETPLTIVGMDRLKDTASTIGTDTRVSFASVVDYSGSIPDDRIDDIETALSNIYAVLNPPFESSLIHFSTDVRLTQDFTSSATDLTVAAKNRTMAREYTSLFDGMKMGVEKTATRSSRLRFVLTFTDGAENDSTATEATVTSLATTNKIPLVNIGVGFADVELLKRMATSTGGLYVYVPGFGELNNAFELVKKTVLGAYQIKLNGLPTDATQIIVSVNTGSKIVDASLGF